MVCPHCREGTRSPRGNQPERCIDKACPVDRIQRNNRGDAWAWDHTGRLIYKPNRHPLPVDTEAYVRETSTLDLSADDAFLARKFGALGFSVKNKEART